MMFELYAEQTGGLAPTKEPGSAATAGTRLLCAFPLNRGCLGTSRRLQRARHPINRGICSNPYTDQFRHFECSTRISGSRHKTLTQRLDSDRNFFRGQVREFCHSSQLCNHLPDFLRQPHFATELCASNLLKNLGKFCPKISVRGQTKRAPSVSRGALTDSVFDLLGLQRLDPLAEPGDPACRRIPVHDTLLGASLQFRLGGLESGNCSSPVAFRKGLFNLLHRTSDPAEPVLVYGRAACRNPGGLLGGSCISHGLDTF